MIDLSILVCTTHTRYRTFGLSIQDQLWPQFEALPPGQRERVEILILNDSKSMMLGRKRNALVDLSLGKYVAFVDDDDRIEPDYLASLLDATDSDADVITLLVSVSLNGEPPKICRYSKDFECDRNTDDGYERLPNHICCVKRELSAQVDYPSVIYGEDAPYSKLLRPLLKTEYAIDRVLYHYDYSAQTSEPQEYHDHGVR
jgi:glycosyltransferase involved in cell wall biosynthesis